MVVRDFLTINSKSLELCTNVHMRCQLIEEDGCHLKASRHLKALTKLSNTAEVVKDFPVLETCNSRLRTRSHFFGQFCGNKNLKTDHRINMFMTFEPQILSLKSWARLESQPHWFGEIVPQSTSMSFHKKAAKRSDFPCCWKWTCSRKILSSI